MASINPQFQQIGQQVVEHYYGQFDQKAWQGLVSLFNDKSMMTFEGEQFQGAQTILQKLSSLGFQTVQHRVVKHDYQPNPTCGGVFAFVTGDLVVNGSQNIKFAETFHITPSATGGFVLSNIIFRLNP